VKNQKSERQILARVWRFYEMKKRARFILFLPQPQNMIRDVRMPDILQEESFPRECSRNFGISTERLFLS
jgi:hypothetical protein